MGSNHRMTHIYYSDRYCLILNGVHDFCLAVRNNCVAGELW